MTGNGSHVTWRELNLALEPIKGDVEEIKADVKVLVADKARSQGFKQAHHWIGTVVISLLCGGIPTVVVAYWLS